LLWLCRNSTYPAPSVAAETPDLQHDTAPVEAASFHPGPSDPRVSRWAELQAAAAQVLATAAATSQQDAEQPMATG
jgi:hypothetical protein